MFQGLFFQTILQLFIYICKFRVETLLRFQNIVKTSVILQQSSYPLKKSDKLQKGNLSLEDKFWQDMKFYSKDSQKSLRKIIYNNIE